METVEKPIEQAGESPPASTRRSNCFDALRLFAALSVVVWHSVRHTGVPFLWVSPGSSAWFFDGVPLFFIMSGMLVYRSCFKSFDTPKPVRNFYINRFLRVGPALYVYALLTPILLLVLGAITVRFLFTLPFLEWFASHILFIPIRQSIFTHFSPDINGSLWTIPVEVSFYLFCPLLVLCEKKFNTRALITVLLGLSVLGLVIKVLYHANTQVPDLWWKGTLDSSDSLSLIFKLANFTFLPYFMFFSLGIFWLRMWSKVSHKGWIALVCFAVYVVLRYQFFGDLRIGSLQDLFWALPFSYVVVWVGYQAPAWVSKITSFGDISYGVYIWHMIVVNAFIYLALPQKLSNPLLTHLGIYAISIAVSYASWKLVEKPCLKLKPFTARQPEAKAW